MVLSSASSKTVVEAPNNELWENENLSQIPFKVFRGHKAAVTSCQFCCSGKFILTSSYDGSVRLWDTKYGNVVHCYEGHKLPVTKSRMSEIDNTKFLSSSWDKTIKLWDVENEKVIWQGRHEGIVTCCDISSDGKLIASASDFDNAIKVWDIREGSAVQELPDHHDSTPTCCVFSPNSQRVASCGMDKRTKVWDLLSKRVTIKLSGHKNIVSSCCFSSNERYLCTSAWDKTLQVWDISTGTFRSQGAINLTKGHDGSVSQNVISGGYDSAIVVWEVENKSKKLVLKGHDGWVTGVDISHDAKWILSSSEDKTIRVWNIEAADHIPAVIENRRAMGLKIVQCENCGKPFSIAQCDDPLDIRMCVFCRLAEPQRNQLPAL